MPTPKQPKPSQPSIKDLQDLPIRLDACPRTPEYHALCERYNAGERSSALVADVQALYKRSNG